jgi:hypothetical protein
MILTSIAARRIQRLFRLYKAQKLEQDLAADQALHDAQREHDEILSSVATSHPVAVLDEHAHLELDLQEQEPWQDDWNDWDNPIEFCGTRCGQQCWDCQRRADYYEQMSRDRFDMADEI